MIYLTIEEAEKLLEIMIEARDFLEGQITPELSEYIGLLRGRMTDAKLEPET